MNRRVESYNLIILFQFVEDVLERGRIWMHTMGDRECQTMGLSVIVIWVLAKENNFDLGKKKEMKMKNILLSQ